MRTALQDCLVVDFTTLLPGPLASLILAEAGAEVVKVERPEGEDMRRFAPFVNGQSLPFAMLNRGKKTVALDLKDERQRQSLMPLLERADIVLEQFRPGVMARLGLDYQALAARNPRLIYCSITGYGSQGPLAHKAGHDLNYIADSGLLGLSHGTPACPVLPPAQLADIAGGSFPAVINILLALLARERGGKGCFIDISMTHAMFTFMPFALAEFLHSGAAPQPGKALLTGGLARYNLYPAADGRLIAIAALEERFWQDICDITGLEAHLRDDFVTPLNSYERLKDLIAAQDSAYWQARFAGRDSCVSLVKTLDEAVRERQFSAWLTSSLQEQPGLPLPIFAPEGARPRSGVPAIGQHNREFLQTHIP